MSFSKPIVLQLASDVYAINEFGLASIFIIVGKERALVIDTGMGYFDLRSTVEKITSLPCLVVLTHGHLDHCGGIDQFDTVYLHPADHALAKSCTRQARIDAGERMRGLEGDSDVWSYGAEQVREWAKLPRLLPLDDNRVFDLGGRTVSTVFTPGHSAGSCCFIESESRILFSGDACNVSLRITDCSVEEALEGLLRLQVHEGEFDRNFNGHLAYSSGMNHISMPKTTLNDCIAAMRRILNGTAEPYTQTVSRWADRPVVRTYMNGAVSVTWCPGKLYREDEQCL